MAVDGHGNAMTIADYGRAAGEPYRLLKKLNQVCDLTRDGARGGSRPDARTYYNLPHKYSVTPAQIANTIRTLIAL